MNRLPKTLCLALVFMAGSAARAEQGRVVGITGEWRRHSDPLQFGSVVQSEEDLDCSSGGALMVQFRAYRAYAQCKGNKFQMREAIHQGQPEPVSKFVGTVLASLNPFTSRQPDAIIQAVSREFGKEVREAVVEIQESSVDLAPAFRNSLAGNYDFQLAPVDSSSGIRTLKGHWEPGAPMRISVSGLTPGLYAITLMNEAGRPASNAWVLACTHERYAAASRGFQQVLEDAANWGDDFDYSAAQPLLRAALQALAARNP